MTIDPSLFSHKSDNWETPTPLFDYLNKIFHFTLDPCARLNIESQKRIKTKFRYTPDDDGLTHPWGNEPTFVNPPYSKVTKWIDKALEEYDKRVQRYVKANTHDYLPRPIVFLVPVRSDTRWFHKISAYPYTRIILLKGRLRFHGSPTSAPFPSCLIILAPGSIAEKLTHLANLVFTFVLDQKNDEESKGD